MIDDIETGFSSKNSKKNRPYVVIGCAGRRVRVVPQSTNLSHGVHVPAGALEGLEEGCFVPYSTTIRLPVALRCPCIGHLGEPYLGQIITQARPKP